MTVNTVNSTSSRRLCTDEPKRLAHRLTTAGRRRRDDTAACVSMRQIGHRIAANDRPLMMNSQPGSEPPHEHRRQCRTEDSRAGHDRGVQRHDVGDVARLDELDHEAAARRVVDRLDDAGCRATRGRSPAASPTPPAQAHRAGSPAPPGRSASASSSCACRPGRRSRRPTPRGRASAGTGRTA